MHKYALKTTMLADSLSSVTIDLLSKEKVSDGQEMVQSER